MLSFARVLPAGLLLSGCVSMHMPENDTANLFGREKAPESSRPARRELSYASKVCPPPGTPNFLMPADHKRLSLRKMPPMRYSPGDRFNVLIFDQPEFSGDYAVNIDGTAILPFTGPIKASGLTNAQLGQKIVRTLVSKGLFTAAADQVSVHPVQYAAVNVTVAGAVFNAGRHTINIVHDKNRLDQRRAKTGDNPLDRFVPAAINAASGVRPDADLTKIRVLRSGKAYVLNWRGAITGHPVDDMPLIEGDHVEVGESGCFQSALVRPSQITPAGLRVFLSNLTAPALNNSSSTRDPQNAVSLPYGSRLLQGLVQANCVGGSYATNARRHAVLISRNPKTRKTEVIQRPIEDLVRRADRDAINPYLMPEDAIACYDSAVTEFRDVVSVITGAVPGMSFKPF